MIKNNNFIYLFWYDQGYAFSEDGEYLAYGTSASGSDWVEIHFLRVEGAVELEDRLERVKFSCMSWTYDGKGLFYNSYPEQDGKSDGKMKISSDLFIINIYSDKFFW